MIEGTAVSPKVRRAKTPRVNVQMGRAGNSSVEEFSISAEMADLESIIAVL